MVVALGVVVAAYLLFARSPGSLASVTPAKPVPAAAVARPRVTALARLAPRGEVINVSASEGDRIARLTVHEGQHVEAGTVLAHLESHAERVAERDRVASQLAEAHARMTAETTHGNALIAESQARLRQLEVVSRLETQAQEARVQQLEAELANADRELDRISRLRAKDLIAQQDLDRQTLVVRRNQLELRAAQVVLEKLRQAHDLDVRLARAQLATAEAALPRAQAAIEVRSLREGLRLAEARAERALIRAPVSGQVFKILKRAGEETGTRAILQMGDIAQMYAVAEVYETDIPRVRVGQKATLSSPALAPGITGTVETVGRSISRNLILDVDPAAAADRRVAEVKIRLDDSQAASKLVNLQVNVDIDVDGP